MVVVTNMCPVEGCPGFLFRRLHFTRSEIPEVPGQISRLYGSRNEFLYEYHVILLILVH
jgi:hypothetical protein